MFGDALQPPPREHIQGSPRSVLPRGRHSVAGVSQTYTYPTSIDALTVSHPRILQKHMKRQIISLEGGFQMIADLNAYHAFVSSLKQQRITDDFSSLKMLGHVYIVSDAKDLAQIIRDVTRYGGSYRPEE
jgi:hypothetical protein